jgi:peptide deformylase
MDDQKEQIDPNVLQLIYVPHTALDSKVLDFPQDNIEYRQAISTHMIELMIRHKGAGLSANQINLDAAVHVQHIQKVIVALFNSQIHEVSASKVLMSEGCLSDPGLFLRVKRPDMVRVSWEDIAGKREEATLYGMDCRIFLHEHDHLQGIQFTLRVGKIKLKMARKKQLKVLSSYIL